MKHICLTGGIGSGKTFISSIFKKFGVPVYHSDEKAKELMTSNSSIRRQIVDLFGELAYINEELNRKFLSEMIFKDKSLLKKINEIAHPVVIQDFKQWATNQDSRYVICESAIVIENGLQKHFDKIICIITDENVRIQRIVKRDNSTEEKVREILNNQISDKERLKYADFIINNNDNELILLKIKEIHTQLWENFQNG